MGHVAYMGRDGRGLRGGLAWATLPRRSRYPYPVFVNFLFRFLGYKKLRATTVAPRPSVIFLYLLEFM
jgi:hypothetical protein